MFGLFNINKPTGWTSREVVDQLQTKIRPTKVGHAGTLDPLANGVLVLCVGQATRLIEHVQDSAKRYRATFLLGCESDSEDTEQEVRPLANPPEISEVDLRASLEKFLGTIQQRPPAFSALKVNGRRAYKMARQGKKPELKARAVRIDELDLIDFDYPRFTLDVRCGGGTYIRSLGRDIAQSLGSNAVMEQLTRLAVGSFTLEDAFDIRDVDPASLHEYLIDPVLAVDSLPRIDLSADEIEVLGDGGMIPNREVPADEFAGIGPDGKLLAILRPCQGGQQLRPAKNFIASRP